MTLGGEGSVDTLFCMVFYAGCLVAMQVNMKSCSGLLVDTTHRFCYENCDFLQPSHPRKILAGGGYGYDHEPRVEEAENLDLKNFDRVILFY